MAGHRCAPIGEHCHHAQGIRLLQPALRPAATDGDRTGQPTSRRRVLPQGPYRARRGHTARSFLRRDQGPGRGAGRDGDRGRPRERRRVRQRHSGPSDHQARLRRARGGDLLRPADRGLHRADGQQHGVRGLLLQGHLAQAGGSGPAPVGLAGPGRHDHARPPGRGPGARVRPARDHPARSGRAHGPCRPARAPGARRRPDRHLHRRRPHPHRRRAAPAAGDPGARPRPLRRGRDRGGQLPVRGRTPDGAAACPSPRGAARGRDRGHARCGQRALLPGESGRSHRCADRQRGDPGRSRGGQRAHRVPDPAAPRHGHQDRLHHRALDRPAPARHRRPVREAGPGGHGGAGLPRGHGQRGPRRIPDQDRSGQRHHPGRRLRAAGLGRLSPALHRRDDRGRLPGLPGRDHGAQSRLVEAAQGMVRRRPRLGAEARRAGADERGHLLRRSTGGRRRPRSWSAPRPISTTSWPRTAPSMPASPARSRCSTRPWASSPPS